MLAHIIIEGLVGFPQVLKVLCPHWICSWADSSPQSFSPRKVSSLLLCILICIYDRLNDTILQVLWFLEITVRVMVFCDCLYAH